MANFEKLAAKSTRANMNQQIKDLDLEVKPGADDDETDDNDVNKPGTKAYNKRRDADYQRDLKENPRK